MENPTNNTALLPGGVTQEQLAMWKHNSKRVFQIDIVADDEDKDIVSGYFKSPDINTIAVTMQSIDTDPVQAMKVLFANTWLGGDKRIQEDDELKFSAYMQLSKLVKIRTATVKNV